MEDSDRGSSAGDESDGEPDSSEADPGDGSSGTEPTSSADGTESGTGDAPEVNEPATGDADSDGPESDDTDDTDAIGDAGSGSNSGSDRDEDDQSDSDDRDDQSDSDDRDDQDDGDHDDEDGGDDQDGSPEIPERLRSMELEPETERVFRGKSIDGDEDDEDENDRDEDDENDEDASVDDPHADATVTDGAPAVADEGGFMEAPETDEEMPIADHIEEMMRRLGIVFLIGGIATLIAVTESAEMITFLWDSHIPNPGENRPRLYGPLELPIVRLKVAGLAGVVVGLPAFVYETYRFMKPGLYPNERRYYLAAIPTSLLLGAIGILFAHFFVLPAIFSYFTTYTQEAAVIAFGLAETFNLIVVMMAFMAIVFQIPLFIMLAIMMNLVTRQWLEDKRLIFWGVFLGIAFLFSPDPTGMAPIIVTLTMIVLYEGTLALLRWTGN